jgi:hypothetical protein
MFLFFLSFPQRRESSLTKTLDSGPFGELRVPSISMDFRRNDARLVYHSPR